MNTKITPTIGEAKCLQRNRNFDELFRHQFVLARAADSIPDSWCRRELAGWTLGYGNALPVTEIHDSEGDLAGLLLGIAWNGESQLVTSPPKFSETANSAKFPDVFEEYSLQLGGRFVALMLTDRSARLYGDPVSDFAWVYDPVQRTVGSSVSVLASYPLQPNPKFHFKSLVAGKTVANFQHTIDCRVLRGLSNHYLDLHTFSVHRFWPNADTIVEPDEAGLEKSCERIAEKLALILRSLTTAFPCMLPVTGGHDSRILLACGSGFLSEFAEFSGYRFHNPSRIDTRMGGELVNGLGQEYRTYFRSPLQSEHVRDFRLKNGWACTRKEMAALSILEQYPADIIVLRGGILDMLRANQWRKDKINKPPHIQYGLRRLRLSDGSRQEISARWRSSYVSWLKTLPTSAQTRVYDFAFIEHWLPHTLGAYYLGFHRNFFLNPFNDRELIKLTIGIPPGVRKDETAVRKVIQAACPNLPIDTFH